MECYGSCRIGVSVGMWCRRILTAPGPICSLASSRLGYLGLPTNGRVLLALPPQTPMGAASGAKELSGSGFQMREVNHQKSSKISKNQQKSAKISKSGINLFLGGLGETLRLSADFTSSTHWLIHLQLCNCQGRRQTVHSLKANYTDAMVADKKVVALFLVFYLQGCQHQQTCISMG